MKKVFISVVTAVVMVITFTPTFAFGAETGLDDASVGETIIRIEETDLAAAKDIEVKMNEIGRDVKTLLKKESPENYEKVMEEVSKDKESIIDNSYNRLLTKVVLKKTGLNYKNAEKTLATDRYGVIIDEEAFQELTYTFPISDQVVFEITPMYVSLEVVEQECESKEITADLNTDTAANTKAAAAKATTKSTPGNSTKKLYRGGTKIATCKVSCNFYYNGKKAWYKSGLKGSLKINAPANWKRLSGAAYRSQYSSTDKSYWAYYSGKVACYGSLMYGLVPVKLETVLIRAGVVCTKTGYVYRNDTHYNVSN